MTFEWFFKTFGLQNQRLLQVSTLVVTFDSHESQVKVLSFQHLIYRTPYILPGALLFEVRILHYFGSVFEIIIILHECKSKDIVQLFFQDEKYVLGIFQFGIRNS